MNPGRININGKKKIPCRAVERKVAVQDFPMDWKVMLHTAPRGMSGMARHWARRAKVPIRITSASVAMKNRINAGATMNHVAANSVIMPVVVLSVKKNDSLTRANFLAP